uniref:Uncharacterized protein n=1 Tax=Octopus bimaculoides TaxID=37653 RepID=A0A0L8HGD6_OCTBM
MRNLSLFRLLHKKSRSNSGLAMSICMCKYEKEKIAGASDNHYVKYSRPFSVHACMGAAEFGVGPAISSSKEPSN